MRKNWKGAAAVFAALAFTVLVAGCSGPADNGDADGETKGPITIGSKIDTEGELLASVMQLKLEDEGFEVRDRSQTGTTDVVRRALLTGEIDIYPEYTGNGLVFFGDDLTDEQREQFNDAQAGYDIVRELDEANDVVWLTPAKANNTWAISTREELATESGLRTMTDFAAYVDEGGEVLLAGSDEFFNSPDAMPSFEEVYGFSLTDDQRIVFAGGNTAQTERAAAEGTDGVNFGMAFGTDGALADLGLIVLEDDQGAQPVYWPTPTIRAEVLQQYPEIEEILAPVFEGLTLERLQELNARIQVNGEAAEDVARDFLQQGGFIGQ